MPLLRAVLIAVLLSAGSLEAQGAANGSAAAALEGAWIRLTSIAPNGAETPSPPGVRTFVDGYYSWVQAPAGRPTPDSTTTAAQLREIWGTVTAQSGRYDVVGRTITQRPIADRAPTGMAPGFYQMFAYRVAGDTIWISQIANPNGPLTNGGTGKYVRVR
jgi:hypothetical protein